MDFDKHLDEQRKGVEELPDFHDLQEKIIDWGFKRGIVFKNNAKNQLLKSVSEMGELADAILKDNEPEIIDGIGDVLVTIILLAESLNLDLIACLQSAYNEIQDRKGETKNGTFIKE